jgi:hypothetical protein
MSPEEIWQIWAPPTSPWSLWAKPMLIAQMADSRAGFTPPTAQLRQEALPDVRWEASIESGTLLVVDLPDAEVVLTGLALAESGFRPVPAFNVCTGLNEVIPQKTIMQHLAAGADNLARLALAEDAPPAFLLDNSRMKSAQLPQPGLFDNRWKVFPQDFPSARFLLDRGIRKALLIQRGQRQPQEDVAHVLRGWQDAGLVIEAKDIATAEAPERLTVAVPRQYRAMWYRILEILGLRRNELGGFGAVVPQPSKG